MNIPRFGQDLGHDFRVSEFPNLPPIGFSPRTVAEAALPPGMEKHHEGFVGERKLAMAAG